MRSLIVLIYRTMDLYYYIPSYRGHHLPFIPETACCIRWHMVIFSQDNVIYKNNLYRKRLFHISYNYILLCVIMFWPESQK